jgi:hypothetical protein
METIVLKRDLGLGWGHSSSGRVPAWQTYGPKFKPQYQQLIIIMMIIIIIIIMTMRYLGWKIEI